MSPQTARSAPPPLFPPAPGATTRTRPLPRALPVPRQRLPGFQLPGSPRAPQAGTRATGRPRQRSYRACRCHSYCQSRRTRRRPRPRGHQRARRKCDGADRVRGAILDHTAREHDRGTQRARSRAEEGGAVRTQAREGRRDTTDGAAARCCWSWPLLGRRASRVKPSAWAAKWRGTLSVVWRSCPRRRGAWRVQRRRGRAAAHSSAALPVREHWTVALGPHPWWTRPGWARRPRPCAGTWTSARSWTGWS